ncbi:alpha/beta fold hydrolase [Streptomyces sp. NRRL B-24484]|uniref:alpha/beta fold hydrolase n=1 Tax=Streptomyces sp. NRRL B-24484 TaxID=1463833 RepID=UPI0007C4BEA3|nr:alpha/beta fold hydrolase [Streptomyces sp. NRRL B-24484]
MVERMVGPVGADGVELCTESFGDPADPPVLLVMGTGASMLWWDEDFCRLLAAGGRHVIRYDHRDTGRSTGWPPGRPGYTGSDLVDDAARVLDGHGIAAAHVVGVSAGGALAQLLALGQPGRVLSLVLISTSSAVSGGRELPPPTEEFLRFASAAADDRPGTDAGTDHRVAYARLLAGGRRPFDEAAARSLVRRETERARDPAAAGNHDLLAEGTPARADLSAVAVPVLVVHGTADPMFPLAHGEALAERIPGARLLVLTDAGHGVDRADWPTVVPAVLAHTAPHTAPGERPAGRAPGPGRSTTGGRGG